MIINKPTTASTRIWPNGSKHVGEWKGGLKHGQGTKTYADAGSTDSPVKMPNSHSGPTGTGVAAVPVCKPVGVNSTGSEASVAVIPLILSLF
jgi:hypothetical protein